MSREWKSGDVAIARVNGVENVRVMAGFGTAEPRLRWVTTDGRLVDSDYDGWWFSYQVTDPRPLVVIDSEDREQVERLLLSMGKHKAVLTTRTFLGPIVDDVKALQTALRELANPTPPKLYREHTGSLSPWPVVDECRFSHREGHECPQCAWEHEHDWVAWVTRTNTVGFSNGTPIRCSKCGARKCDHDDCALRRHTHNHQDEVSA